MEAVKNYVGQINRLTRNSGVGKCPQMSGNNPSFYYSRRLIKKHKKNN